MSNERKMDRAVIVGRIEGGFAPFPGKSLSGYLVTTVAVARLSKTKDRLIVAIPDFLVDKEMDYVNQKVRVAGFLRTENIQDKELKTKKGKIRSRLYIFIKAEEFSVLDGWEDHYNDVQIEGYLCKKPNLRMTANGTHIADLTVAVNGDDGTSSYIPSICWGRNAEAARHFDVGDYVCLAGRMQSRTYQKTVEGVKTEKTAYELSVGWMEFHNYSVIRNLCKERKEQLLAFYDGDMDKVAGAVIEYGAKALNMGYQFFFREGTKIEGVCSVCDSLGSDEDVVNIAVKDGVNDS